MSYKEKKTENPIKRRLQRAASILLLILKFFKRMNTPPLRYE